MMASEWTKVLKAAGEQGWRVESTKKGFRLLPPDPSKSAVAIHRTPSDHRAMKNTIAQMRRSGFVWPWPPPKGGKP